MTKLTILEHNATTGQIVSRAMTEDEIAQATADAQTSIAAKLQLETSRKAVLEKLGLTAEEAALLLK
jgi:hypothetical protein